ncbi:hypothetical protein OG948_35045 (plasmid) [Embleya sp. NBC_00888]|uniref:hypothetical protein n=1 Tax=Embleya sp. NBC_00888 TaxID=2975960 RepID=UPI0038707C35|nr:hypothetical protein OG948_35045 [Embleya sp. NBC_00888]
MAQVTRAPERSTTERDNNRGVVGEAYAAVELTISEVRTIVEIANTANERTRCPTGDPAFISAAP